MSRSAEPFDTGPFTLTPSGSEPRDGPPASREPATGVASLYLATDGATTQLTLAYVAWTNGERHVELSKKARGPEELNSLEGRLRLTIHRHDDVEFCELRQARLRTDHTRTRAVRRKVPERELDEGAGLSVARTLRSAGAVAVGTRGEIFGETNRQRSFLCAVFPRGDQTVPLTAFVLVRVLPLVRGVTI